MATDIVFELRSVLDEAAVLRWHVDLFSKSTRVTTREEHRTENVGTEL